MTLIWLRLTTFRLILTLLILLGSPVATFALNVSADNLPDRPVLAPKGDVKGVALQFSDITGWTAEDDKLAADMVAKGLVVLPIDFKIYAQTLNLQTDTHDCFYISGDIHDLAKTALRELKITSWHRPVLVGRGQGATFIYSTIAVGPENTFAGVAALDPVEPIQTRLPTCTGAYAKASLPKGWIYDYVTPLPAKLVYITSNDVAASLRPRTALRPEISYVVGETSAKRQSLAADQALDFARKDGATALLPVVEIPAKEKARAVAVFWSGDGGWRDIDKQIGDWLADQNFQVIGIDSLSYFWHKRTPDEVANDSIAAIHHADPSGQLPILLLGFSFGADVQAFIYNRLDDEMKSRVKLVTMMASERKTGFEITVEGFLFSSTGDTFIPPELAKVPQSKVFCIYGIDDEDSALCSDPAVKAMKFNTWRTPGGHHFDGDYHEIANRILNAFNASLKGSIPAQSAPPASK